MTFDAATFRERRKKFAEMMEPNSVAVFLSAESQHRNNDVEQKFRQDSSFWYLTGFNEPDAALLLKKTKKETISTIFARPKEKAKEIWTGRRAGPEGAKEKAGTDEALEFKQLEEQLEKAFGGLSHFYFDFGKNSYYWLSNKLIELARQKRIQNLSSCQNLLGELRLIKSEAEMELLRQAAEINVKAHLLAMKESRPGLFEYSIEGKIEGFYREQGCNWAYASIVAGGDNATILHYVDNNCVLEKGKLLLIDAGCEKDYYASDITRTFPIGSPFNSSQKEIYELVLNSQLAAIERAKAKNATFDSVHEATVKVLAQGLIDLKLLEGSLNEIIEKQTYRRFYMHRAGHWLGLDVHDAGSYIEPKSEGKSRILRPGMLMTIEPGLYFDPDDESIPSAFRGIGIRIEDDVLIEESGIEILTENLPKSLVEIEKIISI